MATVETVQKLITLMAGRQREMTKEHRAEFQRVVVKTTDAARLLLSGSISTKQLRRMGHPYAKALRMKAESAQPRILKTRRLVKKVLGTKSGTLAPLPINKQTGRLKKAQYLKTWRSGADIFYRYGFNESECRYAKWVLAPQGTRRMRARGFWVKVKHIFYLNARATSFGNKSYQAKIGGQ